ncbi:putative 7kD DNA-binding domain [Prochlorococcus marinus str. SS35]|nr:putative 7kD DNA-binding domain [Prochlorococcus marinus str. SS35]
MSVDTYSQTVMPSLHGSGWQRRHLDWEFKLADNNSEPDETLVEGIINATESFLRSSEVHRLFIQELVQGTFEEATEDHLRSKAVRSLIEDEVMAMLEERKEELLDRLAEKLLNNGSTGDFNVARKASQEGITEVRKLLLNHTESI